LKVTEPGNALSVITSYSFEVMSLALTLRDKKTNNVVAVETYSSLEDVEGDDTSMFNMQNDMMSYIEVPNMEEGDYELEIWVRKSLFLPSKQLKTCLTFSIFIEYVARSTRDGSLSSNSDYEVIMVMPQKLSEMKPESKSKIEVKFNKPLDMDDLA
jgi:hypothetical protein